MAVAAGGTGVAVACAGTVVGGTGVGGTGVGGTGVGVLGSAGAGVAGTGVAVVPVAGTGVPDVDVEAVGSDVAVAGPAVGIGGGVAVASTVLSPRATVSPGVPGLAADTGVGVGESAPATGVRLRFDTWAAGGLIRSSSTTAMPANATDTAATPPSSHNSTNPSDLTGPVSHHRPAMGLNSTLKDP